MIKKVLFIGAGGAGSKVVNELMEISSSINGCFLNSNINEMKKLSKFDVDLGNFLYINGTGTGRDPEKAEELLNLNKDKVGEFIRNNMGSYTTYVLLFSLDGGMGSGSMKPVSKAIKNLNKRFGREVSVNLVGICPKFKNRKKNLKNTLWAKKKIEELYENNIIDSYMYVNNNKMENEKEFNKKIVSTIYNAYNINHDEIDESDATIVNNTRGYKCVLELPSSMSGNMKDAINYAIDNSNFVLPKNIGRCKTIGASFVDGIFDKYEVLDYFNVEDFDKEDYNPFKNIIVLGGCNKPNWIFNTYSKEYKELLDREEIEMDEDEEEFDFDFSSTPKKDKHKEVKQTIKVNSEKDLRDLYDDMW